ncbi:MAG TPA: hypothetical protein VEF04_04610 [Blastocatellia bacterium]|nr:hypothetical protein [Blastocatellia bacterium]
MKDSTKIINKKLIDLELTIQELADERGISRSELSQLINGIRPFYEHRNWLAMRLGLSPKRLWPAKRSNVAKIRNRARSRSKEGRAVA